MIGIGLKAGKCKVRATRDRGFHVRWSEQCDVGAAMACIDARLFALAILHVFPRATSNPTDLVAKTAVKP